ncbi:transcriptional regulator with XRE-family HTH domain [Streptomyces sp. SAI-133]|uniref:helix-turn-helix transcriptional regulator n=1 Tax=unclassified Streptomyces TaxID=2593676 RepID=UPI002473D589|nr:helix-turn-helix transcriptional regulator [Streptomyces sp. SAI-133]MDH6588152.1 transcriptional regulator with XRE-family HTH domain [Streptomyces sp. SAI-133]
MDETLGRALRRWRDRLSPTDVGRPSRPGRRAAGLRREELADLAGLSVDYVVRLEQGRATSPSAQVVASLARALQLQPVERDHAYRLAGLLPPQEGTISTHVPAGVQRMLARLGEFPVGVFSADWTLLSWTSSWAALLGDPVARTSVERNLVRSVFTTGPSGLAAWPVLQDGDALGPALVADLRTALVTYPRDRGLADLVEELRSTSAEFARLWDEGAVGPHVSARKTVVHPQVGEVTCDCDVLTVPGCDIRLVVYTVAAGSADAEKLEFLRVTGGVRADGFRSFSSSPTSGEPRDESP